jgi:myo-inositol-1(or 4)-monophosphatase
MNTEQKNILIAGVKSAGSEIEKFSGKTNEQGVNSARAYDYKIPADKMAENIIFTAIEKSKLGCRIISEESEAKGDIEAEYTVYVDPLDGSVNFSRGIPSFCLGVAVYKKNKPDLAIIYDISTDELFVAEVGKGVTVNGAKIKPELFEKNLLINLEWFGASQYEEIVGKLKKNNIRARTAGCGVLALCYGCIGRGDGAILIANRPWDIAPGMVFATELGCEIKQFNGDAIDLTKDEQNVIAAPKIIFNKLIGLVK